MNNLLHIDFYTLEQIAVTFTKFFKRYSRNNFVNIFNIHAKNNLKLAI